MTDYKICIELDLRDAAALPALLKQKIEEVQHFVDTRPVFLTQDSRPNFIEFIGQMKRCRAAIVKALDPDGSIFQ